MIEEEEEEAGGNDQAWMATFADMATLLMTFFVLLLSFATIDIKDFRLALGSVKDAFGVQFEHYGEIQALATSAIALSQQESTAVMPLFDELQLLVRVKEVIEKEGLEAEIEAELGDRGVIVRVKGQVLFATAEAELLPGARETLDSIVRLAAAIPFPLAVEGHTDDLPIRSRRFPSNWELSTSRATESMRYLVERGVDPKRIGVGGYAHMRPLVENDSADNRAKNRRVEFVFLTPAKVKPEDADVLKALEMLATEKDKNLEVDDSKLRDVAIGKEGSK